MGDQTERIRHLGITLGAALLYLAVFFGLRDVAGQGVESLVVIPIIVTAVFWGWSAGLVAALISFPINLILVSTATSESAVVLIEGGAAARHVLVLLVGGVAPESLLSLVISSRYRCGIEGALSTPIRRKFLRERCLRLLAA